jgi:hypothetical protein
VLLSVFAGALLTLFFAVLGWLISSDGDIPLVLGMPLLIPVLLSPAIVWTIAYAPAWAAHRRLRRFAAPRELPVFVAGSTLLARRYLSIDANAISLLDGRRTILATWERHRVAVVVLEDFWAMTGLVIVTDDDQCHELTIAKPVGDHVMTTLPLGDRLSVTRSRRAISHALRQRGYPTMLSMGATTP